VPLRQVSSHASVASPSSTPLCCWLDRSPPVCSHMVARLCMVLAHPRASYLFYADSKSPTHTPCSHFSCRCIHHQAVSARTATTFTLNTVTGHQNGEPNSMEPRPACGKRKGIAACLCRLQLVRTRHYAGCGVGLGSAENHSDLLCISQSLVVQRAESTYDVEFCGKSRRAAETQSRAGVFVHIVFQRFTQR
jgi:hypothetical protein